MVSVILFHLTQEDAVVVEGLACVLAELLQQVVHRHPAPGLALDVENDASCVHHEGAVAQLQRLMHIVRDHQCGQVIFLNDLIGKRME